MSADFSRVTFSADNHFSAVLAQQGRVQLDADSNEQVGILLHYLRTVLTDVIGPVGLPLGNGGFHVGVDRAAEPPSLVLGSGRMYVDGILVENDRTDATYWNQPDGYLDPDDAGDLLPTGSFLAYLRVWERIVTAVQAPDIREIALGALGPDTAARARVVWQVAAIPWEPESEPTVQSALDFLRGSFTRRVPLLQAAARRPDDADVDVCDVSPEARYRGDNQLFRVEVHAGGAAQAMPTTSTGRSARLGDKASAAAGGATFKWAFDNASAEFAIVSLNGADVQLADLGRDARLGLEPGDWVEIVDDAYTMRLAGDVPPDVVPRLRRIRSIDPANRMVTLDEDPTAPYLGSAANPWAHVGTDQGLHPFLRRWDHRSPTRADTGQIEVGSDGALPIVEGIWLGLADGLQIRFAENKLSSDYRAGDYWLIPARAVSGDVVWPQNSKGSVARTPDGVEYHYAPLGFVPTGDNDPTDLRPSFPPLVDVAAVQPLVLVETALGQAAPERVEQATTTSRARAKQGGRRPRAARDRGNAAKADTGKTDRDQTDGDSPTTGAPES